MVAINQLTIVFGVLGAQAVNWFIAEPVPTGLNAAAFLATWNVQTGWRWMFAVCAVPSFVFFICAWFLPESPRWLASRGYRDRAKVIPARVGGLAFADTALNSIDAAQRSDGGEKAVRFGALFEPRSRRVLSAHLHVPNLQRATGASHDILDLRWRVPVRLHVCATAPS